MVLTLTHAVIEALCTSRPVHRSTILSKLIPPLHSLEGGAHTPSPPPPPPTPPVLTSPRGASCSKESSVRALVKATVRGAWRLPRHTGVTGSLWHQAKPTSARRRHEPIFIPSGWPGKGHGSLV